MSTHSEKTAFQVERIAFFSDAVFAIAITLLVIEIKVPELHAGTVSDDELWRDLRSILPRLAGFLTSFLVIGAYWVSHHRLFGYVTSYNYRFLWRNLLFLLSIVVMPFSTAVLSEYFDFSLRVPLAVYTVSICMTAFFSYRLWNTLDDGKLTEGLDPVVIRYNSWRAIAVPSAFVVALALSFISNWVAYLSIPFLPLINALIRRYYKKRYPSIITDRLA